MTKAPKSKKGGKKAIIQATAEKVASHHKVGHHSHSKTNSKSRHKKS